MGSVKGQTAIRVFKQHIRTSNPIGSTFATVRLRTVKTRNCVARTTILAMAYKLGLSAQKKWNKLCGFSLLAEVIRGVQFQNGEPTPDVTESELNRVAIEEQFLTPDLNIARRASSIKRMSEAIHIQTGRNMEWMPKQWLIN